MKSRIIKRLPLLAFALILMAGFSSCSESDEVDTTAEKYVNWDARNSTYFSDTLQYYRSHSSNTTYKVFRNWKLDNLTPVSDNTLSYDDDDYIAVRVLHDGGSLSSSPQSTDSVRVHYAGFLINGDCFDSSWSADDITSVPDYTIARPSTFIPTGVVDGFATALLQMHVGDEWLVTIPAKMGYKASAQGTYGATSYIPANSTLIFRIKLDSYYRK